MDETRTASKALAQLCARVAKWREREGGRGSRVPDALWQEAVATAGKAGLYATARATRFNYERLKERWEKAAAKGGKAGATAGDAAHIARRKGTALAVVGSRKEAATLGVGGGQGVAGVAVLSEGAGTGSKSRFITVRMPAVPPASHTSIEVVGRHGDRMRVEVAGDIDVIGLAQAFWGQQS
jgi:hypothetical protein